MHYFVVRGSFVSNDGVGFFAFYIQPRNPATSNNNMLCMFVQVKGEEVQEIDSSFQETFEMLCPRILD
jgi:hypothetical protein